MLVEMTAVLPSVVTASVHAGVELCDDGNEDECDGCGNTCPTDLLSSGDTNDVSCIVSGFPIVWVQHGGGEVGDGTTTARARPDSVQNLTGVTQVATGRRHNLRPKGESGVWCWGYNNYGQLGDGNTGNHSATVRSKCMG